MFGVHPSGLSWILLFSVACRLYAEVKGKDGEDGSTSILEESWGFGMWPLEGSYSRLGKNKTESSHVIEMGVPEEVDSRHHRYHRHQRHLAELQHKDSCPLLERENREREGRPRFLGEKMWNQGHFQPFTAWNSAELSWFNGAQWVWFWLWVKVQPVSPGMLGVLTGFLWLWACVCFGYICQNAMPLSTSCNLTMCRNGSSLTLSRPFSINGYMLNC